MFAYIRKKASQFISWFIPNSTKKMIVLTGSGAVVTKFDEDTERRVFIREMNSTLKLAVEQNSMLFAIEVGRILWNDLKLRYTEGKLERMVLAEAIYDECPDSLRYADRGTMVKDITSAIAFAEKYAH